MGTHDTRVAPHPDPERHTNATWGIPRRENRAQNIPMPKRCRITRKTSCLVHLSDQLVNLVFAVTQVSSFDEVLELPLLEAAIGAVELKWPQEVGGLLEVGANCEDLVDEIFHADHTKRNVSKAVGSGFGRWTYPYLPSCSSMISLSVRGMRCLSTLP